MTTETFVPAPPYTVAGTGPYAIGHDYTDGAIRATVALGETEAALTSGVDFFVSPDAGDSGNLTLAGGVATFYAGGTLTITRKTTVEQGFAGQTARESAVEAQLDRNVQALQEVLLQRDLADLEHLELRELIQDVTTLAEENREDLGDLVDLADLDAVQEAMDAVLEAGRITRTILTGGSGNYSPPSGCRAILVQAQGGGGGGGGAAGGGVGTTAIAASGGAGGYVELLISSLEASYTYTVGSGGAGGAAGDNDGSAGAPTTFAGGATSMSAGGGAGGAGHTATSGTITLTGTAGGSASGGDIDLGGEGTPAPRILSGNPLLIPFGAPSRFGAGGRESGANGMGYGGGGGGAITFGSSNMNEGGNGRSGIIVITEFY